MRLIFDVAPVARARCRGHSPLSRRPLVFLDPTEPVWPNKKHNMLMRCEVEGATDNGAEANTLNESRLERSSIPCACRFPTCSCVGALPYPPVLVHPARDFAHHGSTSRTSSPSRGSWTTSNATWNDGTATNSASTTNSSPSRFAAVQPCQLHLQRRAASSCWSSSGLAPPRV
jgi:hypothetical protein